MRGYQKKVIHLKNTGSPLFDEAIFIVSREGESVTTDHNDMVFEANRIIEESLEDEESRLKRERGKRFFGFAVPFFLGALISAAIASCLYAITHLII